MNDNNIASHYVVTNRFVRLVAESKKVSGIAEILLPNKDLST